MNEVSGRPSRTDWSAKPMVVAAGWSVIAAAVALPATAIVSMGRMPGGNVRVLLVAASLALCMIGLWLAVGHKLSPRLVALRSRKWFMDLLSLPGRRILIPCGALVGMLFMLAVHGHEFVNPSDTQHLLPLAAALLEGSVTWCLAYFVGFEVLRLARCGSILAAWLAIVPLMLLVPLESMLLHYGGERLELRIIGEVSTESVAAWINLRTVAVTALGAVLCAVAATSVARLCSGAPSAVRATRNVVLLVAVGAMPLTGQVTWALGLGRHYQDARVAGRIADQSALLVQHPLHRMAVQCVEQFTTQHESITADAVDPACGTFRIRYGQERTPSSLGREIPRVIIVVFVESLGGCLLRPLNARLPGPVMPRLEQTMGESLSVANYWCVGFPTTPGLCASICSHPNHRVVDAHAWRQSCVAEFVRAGWDTVMLSSVATQFDGNDHRFRKFGFQRSEGAQDWRDTEFASLISEWGLPDRALFQRCLQVLREPRERPLLIALLTCDTHSPGGRTRYGYLEYPDAPNWISERPAESPWLTSFFRLDHDLSEFIGELRCDESLFNETVLVVTGDHAPTLYGSYSQLIGSLPSPRDQVMPLVMLSGSPLPQVAPRLHFSQLDLAPTLLHLAGLRIPSSYWGDSIFDHTVPQSESSVVSLSGQKLRVIDQDGMTDIACDEGAPSGHVRLWRYVWSYMEP